MLTQARLKELFHYCPESGLFTRLLTVKGNARAGDVAGSMDKNGYLLIRVDGGRYQAHRLVILYVRGVMPSDQIDHINGIRSDNRLWNLRCVTRAENLKNKKKPKNNTSGINGVYWVGTNNKWRVIIGVNGKAVHIGYFDGKFEASCARKSAERKYEYHKNHGRIC